MKRNSTLKSYTPLKRGNGFKKSTTSLKRSSFKRTPNDLQKQVREADSKFSKFIINRDKKCLRCGRDSMLTCSHFHGRANYATRYEPLNCIALCVSCHDIWESKKSSVYMDFMLDILGKSQFMVLDHLSKLKISKTDSLILAQNLLNKVEENSDIQY